MSQEYIDWFNQLKIDACKDRLDLSTRLQELIELSKQDILIRKISLIEINNQIEEIKFILSGVEQSLESMKIPAFILNQ